MIDVNHRDSSDTIAIRTRLHAPKLFLLSVCLFFAACATSPPRHLDDACKMLDEMDWYEDVHNATKRWHIPEHVILAIIHQESRFRSRAKPPRNYLLGFIPWGRKSSAYGYGQVKDSTWEWYKRSTSRRWADRDDFEDVADFVAWYCHISHQKLGIREDDAYRLYLAYHEGHGGYARGSYRRKPWLIRVAKKVERRSEMYRRQIDRCRDDLEGWHLWPFF